MFGNGYQPGPTPLGSGDCTGKYIFGAATTTTGANGTTECIRRVSSSFTCTNEWLKRHVDALFPSQCTTVRVPSGECAEGAVEGKKGVCSFEVTGLMVEKVSYEKCLDWAGYQRAMCEWSGHPKMMCSSQKLVDAAPFISESVAELQTQQPQPVRVKVPCMRE